MHVHRDQAQRRGEVVLIVAAGELAERAVKHLSARFPGLVVLQEAPETKWRIIRRRTRLLGPVAAWGQVAAGLAIRLVARFNMARAREIRQADPVGSCRQGVRIIQVSNVNSKRCQRALQLLKPKAVAVYGTRIISQATLDSVAAPFINYHAGINPKYRGQHPAYWARVAGDDENTGVTVHLVDNGVDTGEVIAQAPVEFSPKDNIATYQYVQLATGMSLLAEAIRDALAGRLRTRRVALPSKLWFPPTIWQYVWNGAVKGVW
jgi:folate-dependent phosphoribosylglycinamide formyltransferase PurN